MSNGKWKQFWSGRFENEAEQERDIRQQAEHITLCVVFLTLIAFNSLEVIFKGEYFSIQAIVWIAIFSMTIVRAVRKRTCWNIIYAAMSFLLAIMSTAVYLNHIFK